MKQLLVILISTFILSLRILVAQSYITPVTNVVDTVWGTAVEDPYRWLESLNSDSTAEWFKQQRKITRTEKTKFYASYTDIYGKLISDGGASFPNFIKEGPYYFQFKYTTEYSTPILFYKTKVDGDLVEAYNPNIYFNKEPVTVEDFYLSNDARYLAVSLSIAGTDWRTIKVRDLKKGKNLPDKIEWVKFSNICWTDSGFFYSKFKDPPAGLTHIAANSQQQLCFHKLGDSTANDGVVYSIPDKANTFFHFDVTSDNQYLILYTAAKLNGEWCSVVAYQDLEEGIYGGMNLFLASSFKDEISYNVIDHLNGKFLVQTNLDAPHCRLLLCDKDAVNKLELLVPEYKEILKSVYHVNKKIVCLYFNNGSYTACLFDYEGELLNGIKFPQGINVKGFYGEPSDTVVGYYQNAFYTPPVVYTWNLNSYKTEQADVTKVHYDADDYTTEIVTYKSKDGTEVPMYLTHKKKLKRSAKNPVILYGYGGFGISTTPFYTFANILFFENNGILAVPLIRGGGEFGKTWHDQGKGLNKQNSFDDFISAAEYLIDSGYTSKERLALRGGSNGGLLVGAVLTQRPDLFKVAIGEMGVYDMLRYHLFTGNRFIGGEYGTSNDSIQFKNLLKYSPLHNVKSKVDYPATLLLTAQNDDRVPPFHSYKFLAALQANADNTKPHILYFEEEAGHQGAERIDYRTSSDAFILAFIFRQMGIDALTGF